MADLPLIEIEFRMTLLPPISRGAHLAGPRLHAERLVELWKAVGEVPLQEAFRLLDAEAVAGAILRTSVERDYRGDSRHWHFAPLADLLPELRALAWQDVLAGQLVVEAIPGERGKRHRTLLPLELPRLTPDWELSRLTREGRDAYVEVRVRHLPAVASARPRLKRSEIKTALLDIMTTDPTLAGEALETALCEKGTTRAKARNAIKRWAQQTVRPRGRPRTNKSPK
jgi:hypothetical protein